MSITYTVVNMRFVRPSPKVAEKNPERFGTVYGTFYDAEGMKLSITSKNVDREDALSDEFAISVESGTLTLPEGKRGRKAAHGLSDSDILSVLTALRNPEPEAEPEAKPEAKPTK
jgi:hypothetical protein